MLLSDTIRFFLDGIGRSEEYEYYLSRFHSVHSASFALFCPDLQSCNQAAEAIVAALRSLLRLGLSPAVLLCGPFAAQAYSALLAETPEKNMYHLFHSQKRNQTELHNLLKQASETARQKQRCLVLQEPEKNMTEAIASASQLTLRLYFIRLSGEICDTQNKPLLHYYFDQNFASQYSMPPRPQDKAIIEVSRLLLASTASMHISLTSPFKLLKEIFTLRGAGTIFRKRSVILYYKGIQSLDAKRLLDLFSRAFDRDVSNRTFLRQAAHIYIEENYQGALLLEEHPLGLYLSKFAVDAAARGVGIAAELWQRLEEQDPKVFWRSRNTNSMVRWYRNVCDGCHRTAEWIVFWKGLAADRISEAIDFCKELPDDFQSRK